jgi:hypothetical protein
MNKTPEMVAMDRWFSTGPDLVNRYTNAINSVIASQGARTLPTASDVLDNPTFTGNKQDAFRHFGADWLNEKNPTSGGRFWPHVPTFTIISWFQIGVLHAARKGLGWAQLQDVLPLVTTWVCTSPAGTGTVEVDAIRGPTVVELIIATPQPKTMQARIAAEVQTLIDEQWIILHCGPERSAAVNNTHYPTQ